MNSSLPSTLINPLASAAATLTKIVEVIAGKVLCTEAAALFPDINDTAALEVSLLTTNTSSRIH